MRTKKEIEEIFKMLGLHSDKERKAILVQGNVTKENKKSEYSVTCDDVTTIQRESEES